MKPGRYPFIDTLRGLAVIFMIETHVVNALLLPRHDDGFFRGALTFLNGLVAPAFLFCAGLGFAIALWRSAAEGRPGRGFAVSLLKKSLFIMLVGYSMHVPTFSLEGMLALPAGAANGVFQVDILQVIAVSLLVLLGVAALFPSFRSRIAVAWLLGTGVITAGAAAGATALFMGWGEGVPVWIAAYFSRDLSPLFTLVPWAAYPATGFIAGSLFVRGASAGRDGAVIRRTALAAGAALSLATVLALFTAPLYGGDSFWYWSAEYVVVRLAAVVLVMCAIWFLTREGTGRMMRAVGLFGRESLPVYYWHLMIVYGKDFDGSFVRLFPEGMGYQATLGMVIGLVGLMYVLARVWSSVKKAYPRVAPWCVRGIVAGSVATFLLS